MLLANTNPLKRPLFRKPGIDLNHPASQGLLFSAVQNSGNFWNLAGKAGPVIGTMNGAPSDGISLVGPATLFDAVDEAVNFSGQSTTSPTEITLAVIMVPTGLSGFAIYLSTSGSNAGWRLGTNVGTLEIVAGGVAAINTSVALAVNVPHLIVVTTSAAENVTRTLLLDLQNGATQYAQVASATPIASNGTYQIGTSIFGTVNPQAYIAAAMISARFLSTNELFAWGRNPWGFWFPKSDQDFIFVPPPRAVVVGGTSILRQMMNYEGG